MILSKAAREIIKRLNDASFEAYAVGGAVRDLLMNKSPKDYDVTTNAKTSQIKDLFRDKHVIPTGEKHGTMTVISGGEPVEVTTFRQDGKYIDSRHPSEVIFVESITEDLRRRDFTINAIAYNESIGIVDPFNGVNDIGQKTVRAVGDPKERFHEDALRIMRCIRFASVLGFSIDDRTDQALKECHKLLAAIAKERIFSELKLFLNGDFRDVLQGHLYIFEFLFSGWKQPKSYSLNFGDDLISRLSYFFSGCEVENVKKYFELLKSDNKTKSDVLKVIRSLDHPTITSRRDTLLFLSEFGLENAQRSISLRNRDGEAAFLKEYESECFLLEHLDIDGHDILELSISGTMVGKAKKLLLDAVINGDVKNEKSELLQYLVQKYDSGIY